MAVLAGGVLWPTVPAPVAPAGGAATEAGRLNKPVHSFGAALTGTGAGSGFVSSLGASAGASVAICGVVCFASGDLISALGGPLNSLGLALGIAGTIGTAGTAGREVGFVVLVGAIDAAAGWAASVEWEVVGEAGCAFSDGTSCVGESSFASVG